MKKILATVLLGVLILSTISYASTIKYPETISSVVLIENIDSKDQTFYGTGFFISNDALVLTAAHVIMDEKTNKPSEIINICLIEKETDIPRCQYSARVLDYDTELDLALLYPAYELDSKGQETGPYINIEDAQNLGLPYIDFADKNPNLGDNLTILGYPSASPSIILTKGTVSSFVPLDENSIFYILSDAISNPGNSGSPVYNDDERVVGILTEITVDQLGGNYSYIVSNDIIYLWLLELIQKKVITEKYVKGVFSNDLESTSNLDIFSDVKISNKNAIAINYLKQNGVVNGYSDGTFKPGNSLNRAELLKILVEGSGQSPDAETNKNCFKDVKDEWYAKYVCYAKSQNWIQGYSDNTFKPANKVTKAEAMKMLLEVMDVYTMQPSAIPFEDVQLNQWFAKYISTAKNLNLLEEHDGNYLVNANISRGQISENIYRLLASKKQRFASAMGESFCYGLSIAHNSPTYEQLDIETTKIAQEYGFQGTSEEVQSLVKKYSQDKEYQMFTSKIVIKCSENYKDLGKRMEYLNSLTKGN